MFDRRNPRLPIVIGVGVVSVAVSAYLLTRTTTPVKTHGYFSSLKGITSFTPLTVRSNTALSHNINEIVVDLPSDHRLGGDVVNSVLVRGKSASGKSVIRPYTPVSDPHTPGQARFVIKKYPDGAMSTYMHARQPGDTIEVAGPMPGTYQLTANKHKKIALIGGGSGITPLFQIFKRIANDPEDHTSVTLYYGGQTSKDLVLSDEINDLVAKKPRQLKVEYFVSDKNETSSNANSGYITKEYLAANMFKPSEDNVQVFVCGPPSLFKSISGERFLPIFQGRLSGALSELGFTKSQVHKL